MALFHTLTEIKTPIDFVDCVKYQSMIKNLLLNLTSFKLPKMLKHRCCRYQQTNMALLSVLSSINLVVY